MSYRIKTASKQVPLDEAEILSRMERFWLAAEEHRVGILIALILLLIVAGIVGGAIWYDAQQEAKAVKIHAEANRFASIQPTDNPEQATKNLDQAILQYRKVMKEFPRSSVAPFSLYQLGVVLERKNDHAGAIEAYQEFLNTFPHKETMLGLVYQRLGYLYLIQGEREKAEQAFSAVLSLTGALNKDHVLFELGKLEEAQSRPEGALARYQELQEEKYKHSPFVSEAKIRIKALGGKSPEEKENKAGNSKAEEKHDTPPSSPDKAQSEETPAEATK